MHLACEHSQPQESRSEGYRYCPKERRMVSLMTSANNRRGSQQNPQSGRGGFKEDRHLIVCFLAGREEVRHPQCVKVGTARGSGSNNTSNCKRLGKVLFHRTFAEQ